MPEAAASDPRRHTRRMEKAIRDYDRKDEPAWR